MEHHNLMGRLQSYFVSQKFPFGSERSDNPSLMKKVMHRSCLNDTDYYRQILRPLVAGGMGFQMLPWIPKSSSYYFPFTSWAEGNVIKLMITTKILERQRYITMLSSLWKICFIRLKHLHTLKVNAMIINKQIFILPKTQ